MAPGWFSTQLEETERFLKAIHLFEKRNKYPGYQALSPAMLRSMSYRDSWQHCYDKQLYDFILVDWSLVQFNVWSVPPKNITNYSYSFLDCPLSIVSYERFCREVGQISVEDAGEDFRDWYEDDVLQRPLKETVTPVRYDYAPQDYRPGLHPASHLHMGHSTDVRLGISRILKPLSFALLICRQFYPSHWESFLRHPRKTAWGQHSASSLDAVDKRFFNDDDGYELRLN